MNGYYDNLRSKGIGLFSANDHHSRNYHSMPFDGNDNRAATIEANQLQAWQLQQQFPNINDEATLKKLCDMYLPSRINPNAIIHYANQLEPTALDNKLVEALTQQDKGSIYQRMKGLCGCVPTPEAIDNEIDCNKEVQDRLESLMQSAKPAYDYFKALNSVAELLDTCKLKSQERLNEDLGCPTGTILKNADIPIAK